MLRYAFGFRGAALISGLNFAGNALRTDASLIATYIATQSFNLDGNAVPLGATTDALVIARVLRGSSTAAVVSGAVGASPTNGDWTSIRQFLNSQCLAEL